MGIISIEKANNLYWLGRYSQRVYRTIKDFYEGYDVMLDRNMIAYQDYCEAMNIPDVYGSKEVFIEKYPYDTENPDSIISNLYRAFDNAMVMRDYISSESLSFIQLAIFSMKTAKGSDAPLIALQDVLDYLLAFWGCMDENIDDSETRNLIKFGKAVEHLDIELRVNSSETVVKRCFDRMNSYLKHTDVDFNDVDFYALGYYIIGEKRDYKKALEHLGDMVNL